MIANNEEAAAFLARFRSQNGGGGILARAKALAAAKKAKPRAPVAAVPVAQIMPRAPLPVLMDIDVTKPQTDPRTGGGITIGSPPPPDSAPVAPVVVPSPVLRAAPEASARTADTPAVVTRTEYRDVTVWALGALIVLGALFVFTKSESSTWE
jgi:hypothetical protein